MRLCRLILVVGLVSPVFGQTLNPDERLQLADGLYTRKMYELALKEYEAYLGEFSEGDKIDAVHFRLGECYRHTGETAAAEKHFRAVFTKFPESEFRFRAGFRRADLFLQSGQLDAARDLFKVVLDAKPPTDITSACLYYLGDLEARSGRDQEALAALARVKAEFGTTEFAPYAVLKMADIYGKADSTLPKALLLYEEAAQEAKTERVAAEAYFQVGQLRFRRKEFKESAEAYRRLLDTYPNDRRAAEARLQAAWAFHNSGLYAEGLKQAAAAVSRDSVPVPLLSEWMYVKGNCERQLMQYDAAAKTYSELLKHDPKGKYAEAAAYEWALTYYRKGDFKQAVEAAKRLRPADALRKDVYWLLAESYSALDEEEEAIQYYRLIAREYPDSDVASDATYRLAHHLQTRGEFQEASRYYLAVATGFPDGPLAPQSLFASAVCLVQLEQYADGARDWSALVQKYPKHALVEESLYQKGMCEVRLRRDEDSLSTLRDLLELFPQSRFAAESHFWQGVVLKESGKLQDAEKELRVALAGETRDELKRRAQFHLAVILQKLEKGPEAADLFQPLLKSPEKDRFSPALLEWLALVRLEQTKPDLALEAALRLVDGQTDKNWGEIGWCLVGRAQTALKKNDEAASAFRKALEQGAGTSYAAEAALRLGELALVAGAHEEASGYFTRTAALASSDGQLGVRVRAYVGLANAAKALGDHSKSARFFMSVAILYDDPELVPMCLFEAAEAFAAVDRDEEAERSRRELRERYPESPWAEKLAPPAP